MLVLDDRSPHSTRLPRPGRLLVDLSRRLSLSLLLISHDLAIVRHVADVVSVMYLGVIVESGPTQPLRSLPLHPYTEALIGAVPSPDGSGVLLEALPGEVPDQRGLRSPAGFIRAARTPSTAVPEEEPSMIEVAPARSAACWLRTKSTSCRSLQRRRRLPLLRADE